MARSSLVQLLSALALVHTTQAQCYYPSYMGDGYCDSYTNTPNCDWDGGDCCYSTCVDSTYTCSSYSSDCQDPDATEYVAPLYPDCEVYYTSSLGDGYCNGGSYNVDSCGWDGGDCCNSTCVVGVSFFLSFFFF